VPPLEATDQLSHGTRPHFFHHSGAMNLHRLQRRAQVSRDLLIEATGHDMHEDLALAPGQRRQPRHDGGELHPGSRQVASGAEPPFHRGTHSRILGNDADADPIGGLDDGRRGSAEIFAAQVHDWLQQMASI
jgi:hypothetical protein